MSNLISSEFPENPWSTIKGLRETFVVLSRQKVPDSLGQSFTWTSNSNRLCVFLQRKGRGGVWTLHLAMSWLRDGKSQPHGADVIVRACTFSTSSTFVCYLKRSCYRTNTGIKRRSRGAAAIVCSAFVISDSSRGATSGFGILAPAPLLWVWFMAIAGDRWEIRPRFG